MKDSDEEEESDDTQRNELIDDNRRQNGLPSRKRESLSAFNRQSDELSSL